MSKVNAFHISSDEFIMSPKIDFVFKLIFGDEKNKKILINKYYRF